MYQTPPNLDWNPRRLDYALAIGAAATGLATATASLILYATDLPPLFVPGCSINWRLGAFLGLSMLVTLLEIWPLEALPSYRRRRRPIDRRLYRWLSRIFWLTWMGWAVCLLALPDTLVQRCTSVVLTLS